MKPIIALALSGGVARGLAHIGALKVLLKNKIPIDIITGTSMGSIVGALYAHSLDIEGVERLALETDTRKLMRMFDPSFRFGLIKGKKIESFLKEHLGDGSFESLKIPLGVVASDLEDGSPVYFSRGDLISAIRASISLPFIFTPVSFSNKLLVDGGLTEPLPVNCAISLGADIVIGVNLDSQKNLKERINKPSIRHMMSRTIKILMSQLSKFNSDNASVIIAPNIPYHLSADFANAKKFILEGERAAEEALPEIFSILKKHKVKLE
ncbi:MAG: patatin-like phospholipase family protein [Candidatus Woesearchaeota archaeon]